MSGSLATEQAILQENANIYAPLDGGTPGNITLSPGDLYPGSGGSVTDAQGNVFTLTQMDGLPNFGWVTENGDPVPNGDYTAALASSNGQIFAEDGKGGLVYVLNNGQFVPVGGAMPPSDGGASAAAPFAPPPADATTLTIDTNGGVEGGPNTTPPPINLTATSGVATPGNGSFVGPTPDGGTGTYSINPNGDVADLNGQPLTPDGGSSGTGVLQLTTDQMVVGQDENSSDWFLLASKGTPGLFEWQPTGAPTNAAAFPAAPTPSPLGSASMQFIAPNTGVASVDFTQSCSHG